MTCTLICIFSRVPPGPDAVDPAALGWADQFLSEPLPPPPPKQLAAPPGFTAGEVGPDWLEEYLGPDPGPQAGNEGRKNGLWASEYLDLPTNALADESVETTIYNQNYMLFNARYY